jgi:lipopolysaccharide transport system ATP-binding protein
LLEVGTGFHPELTGRENIFLNGAILGMARSEITRKFDEIVAFAEVEKFLDTPVKRYSSGMYVRLAFAVAAHLEPEILIVDEVLAVGDAQFQKKCLGKMEDVAGEGRTVIFVSHQMDAIQRLCKQVIWLSGGELLEYGAAKPVLTSYMSAGARQSIPNEWINTSKYHRTAGSKSAYFSQIRYLGVGEFSGNDSTVYSDGVFRCDLEVQSDKAREISSLSVIVFDQSGFKLVNADTLSLGVSLLLEEGSNRLQICVEKLHLKPGTYKLGLWLAGVGEVFDHMESVVEVDVVNPIMDGLGLTSANDGVVSCNFNVSKIRYSLPTI